MTIRTRKFLGTILLLVLATVWALLGMALAQMPWIAESGWRQAISSASRPEAAAATGRQPTARSVASNAISMPAMFRRKRRCATMM